MRKVLLREDWLQNEKQMLVNMESTYLECFADTLEADVDSFEGMELPAEAVLVEDIVTDRAGQYMCTEFINHLGSAEALRRLDDGEEDVLLADDIMEELNEVLWSSDFYKKWVEEHPYVQCYVGYWEGGIGLLMDVSL